MKTSDTEYLPQDDESEAERYRKMVNTDGFGEVLNDEQIRFYSLNDLGVGMSEDMR